MTITQIIMTTQKIPCYLKLEFLCWYKCLKMAVYLQPTTAGASKPGKLAQQGYGFDTAMTIL